MNVHTDEEASADQISVVSGGCRCVVHDIFRLLKFVTQMYFN